jgi:hypothetical protein
MAKEKGGLRTRYLKGGISSWNGEKTERKRRHKDICKRLEKCN